MSTVRTTAEPPRTMLERALGVVTEVRSGEGGDALLMTLNIFLLLTAYYVIKPVREGLVLAIQGGARYKSYLAGAIAVALLVAVPAYAAAARRLPRNRLVVGVTAFFALHLLLFRLAAGLAAGQSWLGIAFFVWVGIFNMMVVAQFWAFANDVYDEEQGKRLFALIGIGASAGAALGSQLTELLVVRLGSANMLVVSAAILGVCGALTQLVHRRSLKRRDAAAAATAQASAPAEAAASEQREAEGQLPATSDAPTPEDVPQGAFAMVFRHRYLTWMAVFSLLFTLVNTNGEYILGVVLKAAARAEVASQALDPAKLGDVISQLYGNFFKWVNVLSLLLQALVVSRLVKHAGLKWTLLVFPLVALLDAVALAIVPVLLVVRLFKTAENAADYSINNTARQMLWLPTTRAMKYRAKQAVDTFFVRMGDVGSALLVALLAGMLHLGVRVFAAANVVLSLATVVVCLAIIREYRVLGTAHRTDG